MNRLLGSLHRESTIECPLLVGSSSDWSLVAFLGCSAEMRSESLPKYQTLHLLPEAHLPESDLRRELKVVESTMMLTHQTQMLEGDDIFLPNLLDVGRLKRCSAKQEWICSRRVLI